MGVSLFPSEESLATLEPKTRPRLQLIPPRLKTKLSPQETVSGNRFDIVLACQPDAGDHYSLYDGIVELVEEKKEMRIYSPHNDIKRGQDIGDVVTFTTTEAIPRTRGVLVHLTTITPEIQRMFDSTYTNYKPFVLFYASGTRPFNISNAETIRSHSTYRGECQYTSESHALALLAVQIRNLLKDQ